MLNEAGCYPIYASRMIFDEEPVSVSFNLFNDLETNVDIKGHGIIEFSNERKAFIGFSFENQYQANYKIWGENGIVELKRAYAVPPDFESIIELTTSDKKSEIKIEPTDHFKNMIDIFCQEIQKKEEDSINFEEDLLNQAKLLEAIRESSKKNTIISLLDIQ